MPLLHISHWMLLVPPSSGTNTPNRGPPTSTTSSSGLTTTSSDPVCELPLCQLHERSAPQLFILETGAEVVAQVVFGWQMKDDERRATNSKGGRRPLPDSHKKNTYHPRPSNVCLLLTRCAYHPRVEGPNTSLWGGTERHAAREIGGCASRGFEGADGLLW